MLNRSDIRSDPSDGSVKEGAPLHLVFNVSQLEGSSCTALSGAMVDIWHCDAMGIYSDVQDPSFDTTGQKFLRGFQLTDANGRAEFTTIFPGWYQGRTVHIHFKIRTTNSSQQSYDFTSQLYFDDSLTDEVHAQAPYASKGQRTLRNSGDGIYRNGGDQLTLPAVEDGKGYSATFDIGLQMT
jgi:protocatechuate 3,4-dioxygenase beta subunit